MSAATLTVCSLLAAGCLGPPGRHASPDAGESLGTGEFEGLPTGIAQWKRLCSRGYQDSITQTFCSGDVPPEITSLAALQQELAFEIDNIRNTRVVVTGLSTCVGLRRVTPLNPQAIFVTPPPGISPTPMFTIMAFARGEPLVELVSRDYVADRLRFFVLRFYPRCESNEGGCNFADLFTPSIEADWTGYTLYDDETIKNTPLDCLACHQRDGSSTKKILRMQELGSPWNHWFSGYSNLPNNRRADFSAAHELYAGITPNRVDLPSNLEDFVRHNQYDQPNEYNSSVINREMEQMGVSYSWQALYERSVWGDAIPPPYYGFDQTDPARVAPMISAYQRVMRGELARELLPDIRDTLLDSALPALSIRPKQGLDGHLILRQMCSRCHNSRLDQTQTRALFNVDTLDLLDSSERQLAVDRMNLPDDDPHKMPPPRFHVLSPDEREKAIQRLAP
jgi:hypothetical protein